MKPEKKEAVETLEKKDKHTFVDYAIKADRPYGIIRKRQEQMDALFNQK